MAEIAAICIQKRFLDKLDPDKLPLELLNNLLQRLQHFVISGDRALPLLKRLGDCLVRGYVAIKSTGILLDFIFSVLNQTTVSERQTLFTLYVIELLCDLSWDDDLLIKYTEGLLNLFERCLGSDLLSLRVGGLRATALFLSHVGDEALLKKLEPIIPQLLGKLVELIQLEEDAGIEVLNALSELTACHSDSIKPIFNDYLSIHAEILDHPGFSTGRAP